MNTPTSDELRAENDRLLKELEAESTPTPPKEENAPVVMKTEEVEDKEDFPPEPPDKEEPVQELKESDEEEKKEEVKEEIKPPVEEEDDYRKKFSESTRENQKILAKNRKITEAIDRAGDSGEPTDEEMAREYKEWELMTDTEKRLAKESLVNKRYLEEIRKAREETKRIDQWETSVAKFLDDPNTFVRYPDLEGKNEEFKSYVMKEEHHNAQFSLLVGSFLYAHKPMRSNKQMFPSGSAGPRGSDKPKSDKITVEESETLRKTDYNKYRELLKMGKIASLN